MSEKSEKNLESDEALIKSPAFSGEDIDKAKKKRDVFSELISEIISYIRAEDQDPKDRLAIERKLKKFQDQNTQDWLFNLILEITGELSLDARNND
jgi:hypothetical protein